MPASWSLRTSCPIAGSRRWMWPEVGTQWPSSSVPRMRSKTRGAACSPRGCRRAPGSPTTAPASRRITGTRWSTPEQASSAASSAFPSGHSEHHGAGLGPGPSGEHAMTTTMATRSAAEYYSSPGPFTDLANHAGRMSELPGGVADLCRVVQGLVVHPFFAQLYGLDPRALREDELQTRSASAMLDRILTLDPRPLSDARPPERRFVGNCRHFTTLLCAFLRARRVPARARCGFGAYFGPVNFEDHWVCEVRDEARGTWRLVDAQLDPAQIEL